MMEMQKVRITSDENNSIYKHIYLDGKEIQNVMAADFQLRPGEVPTLRLEIQCRDIEVEEVEARVMEEVFYRNDLLSMPMEYLDFSTRAYNALKRGYITSEGIGGRDTNDTIGDVCRNFMNGRVRRYSGVGSRTYREIEEKMRAFRLIGKEKKDE